MKLRILFGGLMAFVPDGQKAWALLVDARRIFLDPKKKRIPAHLPVLRFDLADVHEASEPPARGVGLWPIDDLDLRIHPGGDSVKDELSFVEFEPGDDKIKLEFESLDNLRPSSKSFAWVAPLRNSFMDNPQDSKIRSNLVAEELDSAAAAPLAARVMLNIGKLGTSAFSLTQDGDPIVFRFRSLLRKKRSDAKQLMAAEVALEAEFDAPFVEFKGVAFGGVSGTSLKLAPSNGGGRVQVRIFNEESEQILGAEKVESRFRLGRLRQQDRLFEEFFKLTVGRPRGQMHLPMVDSIKDMDDGIAVGSPPCSPARG